MSADDDFLNLARTFIDLCNFRVAKNPLNGKMLDAKANGEVDYSLQVLFR